MIISNNGIKIQIDQNGSVLNYQILEQSEDITRMLQSTLGVKDPKSGYLVKSNRFPSFSKDNKIFYLRGCETKKNNKVVSAEFDSEQKATRAIEGLKRIVDFLKEENFPKTSLYSPPSISGGTTHCRYVFINRDMAKILCLTAHDHYPVEQISWKKCNPPVLKNRNWNYHIDKIVSVLNNSLTDYAPAVFAVNKTKELFNASVQAGATNLVAFWRTITGFRDCDVNIKDNIYCQDGSTLQVRSAFINADMAKILDLKFKDKYPRQFNWTPCYPTVTGNKHYDEHLGQIVDVLNKSCRDKEYSEDVVNHHRVSTKAAINTVNMIRNTFVEAHTKGSEYLCAMWSIFTGLRGPDFTD